MSITLVLLGLLAVAVRLDAVADGTTVTSWTADGVIVAVPGSTTVQTGPTDLRDGDLVLTIDGQPLSARLGVVPDPAAGDALQFGVGTPVPRQLIVRAERPELAPLVAPAWGNLIFIVALAGLAGALFLRRPDEPATAPLLVAAAGLFGSTLAFTTGLPALALATAGPVLWLYNLNVIGGYAVAWGGVLAFSLQLSPDVGSPTRRRGLVIAAYALPPGALAVWAGFAGLLSGRNPLTWFALVYTGTTVVVAATLVLGGLIGVVAYRRSRDPATRSRLGWVAGGSVASAVLGLVGWHLPQIITGHQLLPSGAVGLSGLPFVIGIAVALRRHRLFDIERLANRSLVYVTVVALLLAGYAALVAVLVSGLRLSGTIAAAIAAVAAALALAPLRTAAQRTVNRLMYGDRDDPAGVLARLGRRMQGVMLPDEVPAVVVETVAQSLRVRYVAIDLADPSGQFRPTAEHGTAVGRVHVEPLQHHGTVIGRLRVGQRGPDDPLEAADLELVRSLAAEIGPAVQAVRLHQDLLRSRAELVALREDERRRLRRELHDGLGPSLAAIGLKAGLVAREVVPGSAAERLLADISAEVQTGLRDIRRLAEELRPPALDELGLLGALRARAASLTGELVVEVSEPADPIGSAAGADPAERLPAAVETAAFRIAVEAMTNAVRHSGGDRCQVELRSGSGALRLTIRDNGHGLPADRRAGVGLRSMAERAAEVGGTLAVESDSTGTVVTALLPFDLTRGGGAP